MNLLQRLSLCALAGAALPAGAMYINPKGSGQLLLFPYYTVNADQTTLINLVNTSERAKIVQVVVREGVNNRQALRLDLVLAAHDSWTGTLFGASADGPAVLRTGDSSCTVPGKSSWQAAVSAYDLALSTADYSGGNADGGPADAARTREGSVQVIERAQLSGALAAAASGSNPARCDSYAAIDPGNGDLLPPGGGLYGNFAIVNVAQGTILGGNATAIEDFSRFKLYGGQPANELLAQGFTETRPQPVSDATVALGGRMSTLRYAGPAAANAVSALLMADSLQADITREASIGSHTEWVINAPTKHLHTDPARRTTQLAPFAKDFDADGNGDACTSFVPFAYDRNGRAVVLRREAGSATSSPAEHTLCFGVDVLYFANQPADNRSPVLGSRLASRLWNPATPFDSGQVQILLGANDNSTERSFLPGPSGASPTNLRGLPVIGFQAVRYINGNVLPGVLANYTMAQPLEANVGCAGAVATAACP